MNIIEINNTMLDQNLYAVDCHAHIVDSARFPFSNPDGYKPGPNECGTAHEFRTVLDHHQITHALLVNPFAGYATDNSCMLDAIATSKGRFKGIALINESTSDLTLKQLTDGGVIGARFNTLFSSSTSLHGAEGAKLLARVKDHGWFAQIYYHHEGLLDLLPLLKRTGIKVVIDHCGCPNTGQGIMQPEFQALLELGRGGNSAIKLSGAFRYSTEAWPYSDTEPYIRELVKAFTLDRCVWGSDWPFLRAEHRMDLGTLLMLVGQLFPDEKIRQQILWQTPKDLFGFTDY